MSGDATPPDQDDLMEIQKAFRIYDKDRNGYVTMQVCGLEQGKPVKHTTDSIPTSLDRFPTIIIAIVVKITIRAFKYD